MVVLVISKDGAVVESATLCWSYKTQKAILPKRDPDKERKMESMWFIAPENRRKMGKHVVRVLEQFNRNKEKNVEELYGYWAIVGIDKRWFGDESVDWWLLMTNREVEIGARD